MNILQIFYQWLRLFLKIWQAYYLSISTFKFQIFNQLTINLSKLCYLKRDNSAIFHNTKFCFGGKCRLHFVEEKAKVNEAYYMYVEKLLPLLVDDCKQLLPSGFILHQDGSHGPSDTGLAKFQLHWLHCIGWMATKFPRFESIGLPCLGCNAAGSLPQTSAKTQNNSWDLDWFTADTDQ